MPSRCKRQFDWDEALDRALEVFWARGYEGATLPELTAAMGINRPSLYAAFGNKEQLFRKALDRYQAGPQWFLSQALKKPPARAVVEASTAASSRGSSAPGSRSTIRAAWTGPR
jgi:AcrR family transcriptional regulator